MPARDVSKRPVKALGVAQAKAELERLAAEISEHDRRYYQRDRPTISDTAYDSLWGRNAAIERRFTALIRPDSPSRLGAAVRNVIEPSLCMFALLEGKSAGTQGNGENLLGGGDARRGHLARRRATGVVNLDA